MWRKQAFVHQPGMKLSLKTDSMREDISRTNNQLVNFSCHDHFGFVSGQRVNPTTLLGQKQAPFVWFCPVFSKQARVFLNF